MNEEIENTIGQISNLKTLTTRLIESISGNLPSRLISASMTTNASTQPSSEESTAEDSELQELIKSAKDLKEKSERMVVMADVAGLKDLET